MNIAILHSGLSVSVNEELRMLGDALKELGHDIRYIDVSAEESAMCLLMRSDIDAVFVYRSCLKSCSGLNKLISFLEIPIIDQHYCYHNLTLLINPRNDNYAEMISNSKKICFGG
jgi:hypothetical protein